MSPQHVAREQGPACATCHLKQSSPHRCPSHRSLAEHLLAVCRDERAVHHSADLWAGLCSSLASRGSKSLQQTGFEMHPKAGLPDIPGQAHTMVLDVCCARSPCLNAWSMYLPWVARLCCVTKSLVS